MRLRDTKNRHKADAYDDFLENRSAKLAANTPFGVVNTGSNTSNSPESNFHKRLTFWRNVYIMYSMSAFQRQQVATRLKRFTRLAEEDVT